MSLQVHFQSPTGLVVMGEKTKQNNFSGFQKNGLTESCEIKEVMMLCHVVVLHLFTF